MPVYEVPYRKREYFDRAAIGTGTIGTVSNQPTFLSSPLLPSAGPLSSLEAVHKNYADKVRYLYQGSAVPVYVSAATLSMAWIDCNNSTDATLIRKTTSTTIDLSAAGLNGVAQSANLTGTIAVSSGAASVTGTSTTFTTDFQVGDVIRTNGGNARRITVISSNTSMTVESNWGANESGVAYKRGAEAPSTFYYLYIITDGATPGCILSTRNVSGGDTLTDLPSGYTAYRQYPFALRNDASSNIIPFMVGPGPRPYIQYQVTFQPPGDTAGATSALNGGTATTYTDVDLSAFVPKIARLAKIKVNIFYTTTGNFYFRKNGETNDGFGMRALASGQTDSAVFDIETDATQIIEYKGPNAGASSYINVVGYTVTDNL